MISKKRIVETAVVFVVAALVLGVLGGIYFVTAGVSARPQPGRMETFVARSVRNLAILSHAPNEQNPVPSSEQAIADGRAHFADHCFSCHANDGSGNTEMGRGLYPKAPDMRLQATQNLSDHELFYIIENGIRLTGMPAWGTGTPAGEDASWRLVHFIRHLPDMSQPEIEEMQALNPRSPGEIRQEIEAEQFLSGADVEPSASSPSAAHAH